MRNFLRQMLYLICGLVLFWTLVHGVEWVHGKWTLAAWTKELDALGGAPAPESLIPPPIPDEENFARASIVVKVLGGKESPFRNAINIPENNEALGRWMRGKPADLEAVSKANNTGDLLKLLALHEGPLRELEAASRRRSSRVWRSYEPGQFGYHPGLEFLNMRAALRILYLRSIARQKVGAMDAALEDILTSLRILEHLRREPDFTQNIILRSQVGFPMQAIWEGLVAHRWNSRQLEQLQAQLERSDVLASLRRSLAWERLGGQKNFKNLLDSRTPSRGLALWERQQKKFLEEVRESGTDMNPEVFDRTRPGFVPTLMGDFLFPSGWLVQNQVRQDQVFVRQLIRAVDPQSHQVDPKIVESTPRWWKEGGRTPYTYFAAMISMEHYTRVFVDASREQNWLSQASIAIALERYRLDHGEYPNSLPSLVPAYLTKVPSQVLSGEAMGYARGEQETFTLWARNWDEKIEHLREGTTGHRPQAWVWPSLRESTIEN